MDHSSVPNDLPRQVVYNSTKGNIMLWYISGHCMTADPRLAQIMAAIMLYALNPTRWRLMLMVRARCIYTMSTFLYFFADNPNIVLPSRTLSVEGTRERIHDTLSPTLATDRCGEPIDVYEGSDQDSHPMERDRHG